MSGPQPSKELFVARLAKGAEAGAMGDAVEVLQAPDGSELTVVHVSGASDPRRTWARLADRPEVEWAAPALVDDAGAEHLPTGALTVRFEAAPADAELETFASRHDLRVCQRNEFTPRQVTFEPARPATSYGPDLADAVSRDEGVEAAWSATLSRFERSSGEPPPTAGEPAKGGAREEGTGGR